MGAGRSGLGGGGRSAGGGNSSRIDRAGFQNEGGGVYSLDIPGVGGAQVLDETGSSRALRAGFLPKAKAYSYRAWDANYNALSGLMPTVDILPTLNEAKDAAKQLLKNHLGG